MTESHLHHKKHVQSSDFLTDVVIGMSDGLTVPFALSAGLSGAVQSTNLIVIASVAGIAAGSIAMGFGGYLAGRTEIDHYNAKLKREYDEVEKLPHKEREEVREFFAGIGLSEELQQQAVEEMTKDKNQWVDFVMKYELGLDKPDPKRARKSAFNIGVSYVVGGLIPVTPYFFVETVLTALEISAVITIICLFIFGYFKSKSTGVNPMAGAISVTLIGVLAAGCAFAIARLISSA
jgi:vacuolar iron transporter family protein